MAGKLGASCRRELDVPDRQPSEGPADQVAGIKDQQPVLGRFPGLGSVTGARVLAEIGDDRARFANAGSLKAYAGSAPVTRASGKSCVVMSRRVKNQRLAAVGYVWAFVSLTRSPGPEPTTTAAKKPETVTSPPSGTCSTVSWEFSFTAFGPEKPTTRRKPSQTIRRQSSPTKQLDSLSAWDVSFESPDVDAGSRRQDWSQDPDRGRRRQHLPHRRPPRRLRRSRPGHSQLGSSIRGEQPSRRENKQLKRALFLSAFAALGNPACRAYYDKKIAQGKHHTQALLCLSRRRADVLLAMLRDGTFYEPRPSAPVT